MELNQTTRQRLESFITEIPPRLLHTAGLACFFLTAAPSTSGAVCVPAAFAMLTALTRFEIPAIAVPAVVRVSWSRFERGNRCPTLDSAGNINGHVVVITEEDDFIDASVLQFDDVVERRGPSGLMPLVGNQCGLWKSLTSPASAVGEPLNTAEFLLAPSGDHICYALYHPAPAADIVQRYRELNSSNNLLAWEESMADLYAWIAANKLPQLQLPNASVNSGLQQAMDLWRGQPQPNWNS